jgi:hypothetical protein
MCDHTVGEAIEHDEFDYTNHWRGMWVGHYFKCAGCGVTFWRGRTRKLDANGNQIMTPPSKESDEDRRHFASCGSG